MSCGVELPYEVRTSDNCAVVSSEKGTSFHSQTLAMQLLSRFEGRPSIDPLAIIGPNERGSVGLLGVVLSMYQPAAVQISDGF